MRKITSNKEAFKEALEAWKLRESRRASKRPYILFGFVGHNYTDTVNPPKEIARIYPMVANSAFASEADVQDAVKKGWLMLDYFFPQQSDLQGLPSEGIFTESGWRLGLRSDANYFARIKAYCEQITNKQEGIRAETKALISEKEKLEREVEALRRKYEVKK